MADQKVSDLPSLNGADVDAADLLYIVDSSAGAAGSKKITIGQYQLAPVSGGTANTVVYLNGSKVESSSSALTFDGTNFATTGTSSAAKLIPTGGTATGNGMYLPAANTLAWSNNGAETMRLDSSGNLGLGVTPPASTVPGIFFGAVGNIVAGNNSALMLGNSYIDGATTRYRTSKFAVQYEQDNLNGVHKWYTAPSGTAGNAITFTQAMTLDASGNLGIGTTSPSAKLQVFNTTGELAEFYNNRDSVAGANLRLYKSRGTAASPTVALVNDDIGTFQTRVYCRNAGDTANEYVDATRITGYVSNVDAQNRASTALSFWTKTGTTSLTANMTLDSSGNLGLGVTPSAWGAAYPGRIQGLGWAIATPLDGGTDTAAFATNAYNSAGSTWNYRNNAPAALYQQFSSTHRFYTAPSGTAGNAISFTQAMTLDASGNLLVGRTTSNGTAYRFEVDSSSDTRIGINVGGSLTGLLQATTNTLSLAAIGASGVLTFNSNGQERARITSGGNLLVGTTTDSSTVANGFTVTGAAAITAIGVGHVNGSGSGTNYAVFGYNSVAIGSITQNGTTGVLYNTTSDRRLKNNIVPAPSASDDIDAIQIISHDWKAAPDEHVKYGVIAQDLALVAPQAVLQGDDGDEIERTWGVDYSKLVPMLIKEIQTLRARVAALEAK